MTSDYIVTFEFATRPPLTHRGTIVASHVPAGVRLATKAAQKRIRPKGWTSVVCVLLNRRDEDAERPAAARAA